jgi:Flp pilus assembly protein TadD
MNANHARGGGLAALIGLALIAASPEPAEAKWFGSGAKADSKVSQKYLDEIKRALDEQRLVDAGKLLDQALLAGDKTPQLAIYSGQLSLGRGQYEAALSAFKRVEGEAKVQGDSLEGQGLALALLKRSDEALAVLQKAVAAKPSAWRAWNALGSEYDARRRWPDANAAYERAIAESGSAPLALNNRGFSRLLQGRYDEAVADFVEALAKKPDLPAARTNLRLAIAMRGEYDRALAGAPQDSEAANLNNAGFAAMMRGDYAAAESLFDRAMQAKGEFYGRAAANLQLARALKSQVEANTKAAASAR